MSLLRSAELRALRWARQQRSVGGATGRKRGFTSRGVQQGAPLTLLCPQSAAETCTVAENLAWLATLRRCRQ
jgi:hypothetical protein